jgi:hypothetical protein
LDVGEAIFFQDFFLRNSMYLIGSGYLQVDLDIHPTGEKYHCEAKYYCNLTFNSLAFISVERQSRDICAGGDWGKYIRMPLPPPFK